jgi:hypothetical protein
VTKTSGNCTTTSNSIDITANCKTEEELSSSGEGNNQLNLFPNPTSNEVHLSAIFTGNESGSVWLELRNALGQLVNREELQATDGKLEETIQLTDQFAAGLYLVSLRLNDHILTGQLIVK